MHYYIGNITSDRAEIKGDHFIGSPQTKTELPGLDVMLTKLFMRPQGYPEHARRLWCPDAVPLHIRALGGGIPAAGHAIMATVAAGREAAIMQARQVEFEGDQQ